MYLQQQPEPLNLILNVHNLIARKTFSARREVKQMRVRFVSSTGFLLLGIWLIITGIMQALSIGNPTIHVLMGILAFFAGAFILLGR